MKMNKPIDNNEIEKENLIANIDDEENVISDSADGDALITAKEDFAENAPDLNVETDALLKNDDDTKGFILHKTNRHNHHIQKKKTQKKHHKKKIRGVKKVLIVILCVILGLMIALAGVFSIMYFVGKNSILDSSEMKLTPPDDDITVIDNGNYINYNGHVYRYKDSMTSILFMGVDKNEMGAVNNIVGTGGQADALYLVAIDTDNGLTTTFQISRSAMCDINLYNTNGDFISTENAQVCLSYAYGDGKETSAENCITSIRRIFYGLPVAQSYVALDIDGIAALNDAVGGITVTSPVTLGNVFKQGQTYELHGDQAESFVRSRDMEKLDSNTNRMARQKAYLDAFVSKTVDMTRADISTPIDIYNAAQPYMVTDLSVSKVSYLAVDLMRKGVTSADIQKVPGTEKEGENFVEYHIDNDKFFKMIVDTFYVQTN